MVEDQLSVGTRVRVTATPTAEASNPETNEVLRQCAGQTGEIIDHDGNGPRSLYLVRMDSVRDPETGQPFEWGTYADNITPVD